MTWHEWSGWFITLYGVHERQAATVAAWVREVFVPGGMAPAELHAAAKDVAAGGPPPFLSETLSALVAAVRRARTDAQHAREDQDRRGGGDATPAGPCYDCDGSGWAVVPQQPQPPAAVAKDYLATWAVTCKCAAGLRLAAVAEDRRGRKALSLSRYEADAPGWRRERDWWRKHEAAKGRVGAATAGWDRLVQRLLQRAKGAGQ